MKKFLFTIFLFLVFVSFIKPQNDSIPKDTSLYLKNPSYSIETELYKIYKKKKAKIVMLGNSITHGTNWNELINRDDIVERGIGGDLTSGFLNRLKFVYNLNPKVCFIMGGINDIFYGLQVETIFNNYKNVIDTLKNHKIKIVIQSTLFVKNGTELLKVINNRVKLLNKKLKKYANKHHIIFIDLNKSLSIDNHLIKKYTIDGVHLKASGYKVWSNYVIRTLKKLKI